MKSIGRITRADRSSRDDIERIARTRSRRSTQEEIPIPSSGSHHKDEKSKPRFFGYNMYEKIMTTV